MRSYSSVWLAAAAVVVALLCAIGTADLIETPLCGEKHGFAGEFNDHFSIPIETAPADGEAIVLIARTFPTNMGMLLQQWLCLNATFHLPEGAVVNRQSDNDGILEIPRVAAGTDIEVRVQRVRSDGPVPFRFFSFFANRPVCHIAVSKDNSFLAPVPHRLSRTSTPITMYFKTALPLDMNAASIHVVADARSNQPYRVLDKDGAWQTHSADDLIQSSTGGSISFSFSPTQDDIGSAYCFTAVAITYGNVQGGTVGPTSSATPGQPAAGGGGSTGTASGTTSTTPAPASASMSALRKLIWIALFLFVFWQAALAVYNYRVLGKRDVMEIIPCAESVAAGARGLQLVASRSFGTTHRRSDGYDSVQNINDPYA